MEWPEKGKPYQSQDNETAGLSSRLQIVQQVVYRIIDILLRKGAAVDPLVSHRAEGQPVRRALRQIEHDRPFTIPDRFVAHSRRPPLASVPGFPASPIPA